MSHYNAGGSTHKMSSRLFIQALSLCVGVVGVSSAQEGDEAARLRLTAEKYLKQYPEADANGDGELTRHEVTLHAAGLQKREAIASLGDAVKVVEDAEYASPGGYPLRLDLYLPTKSAGKPPLVVWIHGGGWRGGNKDRCLLTWLVAEGYAVASIEYRLTYIAVFPAQIHDCKGAIRWLRSHASEYGYDGDRIVAAGESAGGHLALLVGLSGGVEALEGQVTGPQDPSSRVDAVVNFYGPTDLPLAARQLRSQPILEVIDGLLGGPLEQRRELAGLASPVTHISPDDPPVLIIHGSADPLVPLDQSEHLHKLYQSAGLQSELIVVPNAAHTGPQFTDPQRRQIILAFLDKHLQGN